MKAWPPRLSRSRIVALLALVLVGAGSAWWMFTGHPSLHLRTIMEPTGENEFADEIQGFSPDGSILVVEHERQNDDSTNILILRNVGTGRIVKIIDPTSLGERNPDIPEDQFQGHRGLFHAFSPDGRRLAVGLDEGNVVKIRDTATWQEEKTLRQQCGTHCRFFPDSKMLLIETTRGFTVWDASKGQRVAMMEDWCQGGTTCCRISPDGRELTAVEILEAREGEDHCTWHIGIWDTETWRLKREIRRPHPDYSQFEVAPSGRTLAAACSGERIEIEDVDSGVRISQLQLPDVRPLGNQGEWAYSVECWSADSRHLLITGEVGIGGEGVLWLWDIKKPAAVPLSMISLDQSQVRTSADGKFLATELRRPILVNPWIFRLPNCLQGPAAWCFGKPGFLHPPSQISLRKMPTGSILAQATLEQSCVFSMHFSPDGSLLAVVDGLGRILLYDVPQMRR